MEALKVKDHKEFRCFDYISQPNGKCELGNVIFKNHPNYDKPEIGVIIQTHGDWCEDFRTDMFGNESFQDGRYEGVIVRFATLEEIKSFRPKLLNKLK